MHARLSFIGALAVVLAACASAQPTGGAGGVPAQASVQCMIELHGPPWDGPELVVIGPEGACRTLQVSLSSLGVWDSLPKLVDKFQDNARALLLCGGPWNGSDVEVFYSEFPNPFHPDYGTAVCAALSLPGR